MKTFFIDLMHATTIKQKRKKRSALLHGLLDSSVRPFDGIKFFADDEDTNCSIKCSREKKTNKAPPRPIIMGKINRSVPSQELMQGIEVVDP
ncbi:uncharacterized protein [Rutidosis leptorrhynchoides]|uniref:uncharacterized protein isoform X4 n=1 Tax=Rutidosis leptorrhynchoides TaxID=125765 RepID=UPI003A9A4BBB